MMEAPLPISVVIPTYRRENVLVETIGRLLELLAPGDEIIVVDQTPSHEPETAEAMNRFVREAPVRWYRRTQPGICQAMNCGAWLARGEILLFVDDDVIPNPGLLETHRECLASMDAPPATCGQILQPWNDGPVHAVTDFAEHFNFAYSRECDVVGLMGGNFGIRRRTFLEIGGIDENFFGACYRWEAELAYRILRKTGRKIRFLPGAGLRHLQAGTGGTRSFGTKDTWKHISGSVGDYYFAWKCLDLPRALKHSLARLFRAPINRKTIRRPWLIPSLFLRELVAWGWAWTLLPRQKSSRIKQASDYSPFEADCVEAT